MQNYGTPTKTRGAGTRYPAMRLRTSLRTYSLANAAIPGPWPPLIRGWFPRALSYPQLVMGREGSVAVVLVVPPPPLVAVARHNVRYRLVGRGRCHLVGVRVGAWVRTTLGLVEWL